VEYFVSYYDYYQPEAYIAHSDLYIEKDAAINDEIEKLRHSATAALFERRDVIVVASVSCIYGLGSPIDYRSMVISLRPGMKKDRGELLRKLIEIQYTRNEIDFGRGTFRAKGDTIDIFPASSTDKAIWVEMFDDEIERITEVNVVTGEILGELTHAAIYPASHYAASRDNILRVEPMIEAELQERLKYFRDNGKLLEAERLEQRTRYDLEMLREVGYCTGIENYSRFFDGRAPGTHPYCMLDYFPEDFLMIIDESHVTVPQVGAMYAGDLSRKTSLVDYGFRLPAALDNRPLTFSEFEEKINQVLFVSATPAKYEREHSEAYAEQVIRPTGLVDPLVTIEPVEGQVDRLIDLIGETTEKGYRTLVTTLTKRMAEDLTKYLMEAGIRARYMHSDTASIERMEILRDLRLGEFDVLVGINLLREGLDLPEVALVAILDADKEGFLRSETSLIQTIGRASRNVEGRVVLFADTITGSMERALNETNRRRQIQSRYNEEHGITPRSVKKEIFEVLEVTKTSKKKENKKISQMSKIEIKKLIAGTEERMKKLAGQLEFEKAAELRDFLIELRKML